MSELKDVGLVLKNKRIELGYTISDVQEYIKVKSYYIQAIEDGNEDKLPDPIYVKGFIKSYAEMLGLNSEVFLHDLHLTHNVIQNDNTYEEKRINIDIDYRKIIKKYTKFLVIILIIALISYFIYSIGNFLGVNMKDKNNSFNANNISTKTSIAKTTKKDNTSNKKGNNSKSDTKTDTSTVKKTDNNKVVDNNGNNKINITQLNRTTNTNTEYDYQVISSNDSFKLKVDLTGEKCWMEISVDGQQVYSGTMLSGDSKTFDVKNNAMIYLGKASDVTISIDGQNVDKAASPGVFTYKFAK